MASTQRLVSNLLASLSIIIVFVLASDGALFNCPPNGRFDFGYYEKVCGDRKFSKIDELAASRQFKDGDISEFWETFELCACHLIGHDIFWKAMLTHEAECLYLAIEKSIDQYDQGLEVKHKPRANTLADDTKTGVASERQLELIKQQGLRLYYWDKLEIILGDLAGSRNKNDYSDFIVGSIQTNYSNICYNPMTLELDFVGAANGLKVKQSITAVCSHLNTHAKPILTKLGDLQRSIKNDRLIYRLAISNEELYKIRMVLVLCHNLEMNGMIV